MPNYNNQKGVATCAHPIIKDKSGHVPDLSFKIEREAQGEESVLPLSPLKNTPGGTGVFYKI